MGTYLRLQTTTSKRGPGTRFELLARMLHLTEGELYKLRATGRLYLGVKRMEEILQAEARER